MSKKWNINGDYLLGCNCDYGCPCNFNARPTKGFCEGAIGFRVEEGAYNGVRLDGLSAFIGVKWPGAIYEGNGTGSIYIDEKASPEQRDALIKIISGEAGGPPFEILANTFTEIIGPKFVPIEVKVDGKNTEVTVSNHLRMAFESIRNPVSGVEVESKVVLPKGMIFNEGDQYSLKEFRLKDGPNLDMTLDGKCGEHAKVQWPTG
ncbi:MAG: DUF1326 domain-containing protein [Planctomycetota bacterium]|jgi:hypothetical protein